MTCCAIECAWLLSTLTVKILIEHFKGLDVPQYTIKELQEKAYSIVGNPEPNSIWHRVVAVPKFDGSIVSTLLLQCLPLFDGAICGYHANALMPESTCLLQQQLLEQF